MSNQNINELVIDLFDSNTDQFTLDFGNCLYYDDYHTQSVLIRNSSSDKCLNVLDLIVEQFDANNIQSNNHNNNNNNHHLGQVKLFIPNIDRENTIEHASSAIQGPIGIQPNDTWRVIVVFIPAVPTELEMTQTSYVNVHVNVSLRYEILSHSINIETSNDNEIPIAIFSKNISVLAGICLSLFYVDESDIEFGDCIIGESYQQTVQISNRSECPMAFVVHRLNNNINMNDNNTDTDTNASTMINSDQSAITVQCLDTGHIVFPTERSQHIAAYAAEKFVFIVSPKTIGQHVIKLMIENVHNPNNIAFVTCKFNVIKKNQAVLETISIVDAAFSLEQQQQQQQTRNSIEFGDCYFYRVKMKKLILVNSSPNDVTVQLSSNTSNELFFSKLNNSNSNNSEISDTMDNTLISRIYKSMPPESGTFSMNLKQLITTESEMLAKSTMVSKEMLARGISTNTEIKDMHVSSENTSETWVNLDNIENQNVSMNQQSTVQSNYKRVGHKLQDISVVCGTIFGHDTAMAIPDLDYKSNTEIESTDSMYIGLWARRHVNPVRRRFIGNSTNTMHTKVTIPSSSMTTERDKNSGGNSNSNSNNTHKNIPPSPANEISTPLESSIHNNVFDYIPDDQYEFTTQIEINVPMYSRQEIVVYYRPKISTTAKLNEHAKDQLDSKYLTLSPHNFNIYLSWMHFSQDGNHTSFDNSSKMLTRSFSCTSQCCLSVISVSPLLYDLKECSVGEFYTTTFTITNHSDLSAAFVPYVESETLSLANDQNFIVEPHATQQIQFDYVAQIENTDYHRKIMFLNENNCNGHATCEVRARNVDTQQVIKHSLYYKISTGNNKRQLQIYYDICMMNTPNLRLFRIKNITTKEIRLQLYSDEIRVGNNEIVIVLIKPFDGAKSKIENNNIGNNNNNNNNNLDVNQGLSISTQKSTSSLSSHTSSASLSLEDLKWGSPKAQLVHQVVHKPRAHSFVYESNDIPSSSNRSKLSVYPSKTLKGSFEAEAVMNKYTSTPKLLDNSKASKSITNFSVEDRIAIRDLLQQKSASARVKNTLEEDEATSTNKGKIHDYYNYYYA